MQPREILQKEGTSGGQNQEPRRTLDWELYPDSSTRTRKRSSPRQPQGQGPRCVTTLIQEDNTCTGAQPHWAEGPAARRPAKALMGSASCRAGIGSSSLWQTRSLQRKGGKTGIWEKLKENPNSPEVWLSGINWLFPFLLGLSLEEEQGPGKGELGR